MKQEKLVIIGTGMAALKIVEELQQLSNKSYEFTLIGDENVLAYNRIQLSPLLAGEKDFQSIILRSQQWYEQHNIKVISGTRVTLIDPEQRCVALASGDSINFDKLIIATGSRATRLTIPGSDLPGVYGFRSIEDVEQILSQRHHNPRVAVIGAGLLGLEAASALAKQGLEVSVIHHQKHILNRQLDREAAALLQSRLENLGVNFVLDAKIKAIIPGQTGDVSAIELQDSRILGTDIVIMAVGITPNIELAEAANIHCERAILVNERLETSASNIYAVGECVQYESQTFGLVASVYDQARVLAQVLAGNSQAAFSIQANGTHLKVSDIHLFSAGRIAEQGCEEIVFRDTALGIYKKMIIKHNQLIGVVCYGDIADSQWYLELILSGEDITAKRETIVFGRGFSEAA